MSLMSNAPRSASVSPLRRGDVVELRPPDAILATLDGDGALDGLPFMPEMLGYFGRSYSVAARVERACDTIETSVTLPSVPGVQAGSIPIRRRPVRSQSSRRNVASGPHPTSTMSPPASP